MHVSDGILKDVSQVTAAIMQWEEKWKTLITEFRGDATIPDLWRMSALLDMCPEDVNGQMLMRLDEIGENYENLKSSKKAERSRVGQVGT